MNPQCRASSQGRHLEAVTWCELLDIHLLVLGDQFQELEPDRGQELQRGTTSLPSLPGQSYRQELLGGFPSRCTIGLPFPAIYIVS